MTISRKKLHDSAVDAEQSDFDFIHALYRGLLRRTPDENGLQEHQMALQKGASRIELFERVLHSPEVAQQGIWSANLWPSLKDPSFFNLVHLLALNAPPEILTFEKCLASLSSGQSRAECVVDLLSRPAGPEFSRSGGILCADVPHEEFVTYAYKLSLRRPPDESGFSFHSNRLQNGLDRGQLLLDLLTSKEAQSTDMMHELIDAEFVSLLYREFLNVEPDAAGMHHQLEALQERAKRSDILRAIAKAGITNANNSLAGADSSSHETRTEESVSLIHLMGKASPGLYEEHVDQALRKSETVHRKTGSIEPFEEPLIRLMMT